MRDITDFNDAAHRIESASAVFQKGIYHLFILRTNRVVDIYEKVLRVYQCLFSLCSTQLLLNMNYRFPRSSEPKFNKFRKHCVNQNEITRKDIDPAAIIEHNDLNKGNWQFPKNHKLGHSSQQTLRLYKRALNTRHNTIYRPFLLDNSYWENCTLSNLIIDLPKEQEIEDSFRQFLEGMIQWLQLDIKNGDEDDSYAQDFLQKLFFPYTDEKRTETIYIKYARMLNPDNEDIINLAKEYRNNLLEVNKLTSISSLYYQEISHPGEL